MFRSRIAIAVLVLAMSGCAGPVVVRSENEPPRPNCGAASFGVEKAGLCVGDQCQMPRVVPPEIAEIRRGVYVYRADTQTGSWAEWTAVDFDQRRFLKLERVIGTIVGNAEAGLAPNGPEYVRKAGNTLDIVSVGPVAGEALDEVACAANKLWLEPNLIKGLMFDFTIRIGLRDGSATKVIGGENQVLSGFPASFAGDILSKFSPSPSPALKQLRASILRLTTAGWVRDIGDRVFFETASYVLTDEAKARLNRWVIFLSGNSKDRLLVEGHADDRGMEEANRALGWKRAISVKAYLIDHGIEPWRIDTVTYGKDRPAVLVGRGGDPEAARAQNRRVVGVIE